MTTEIEWTVAGSPVLISDWSASMVAPGGFDRFTGAAIASKVDADQGAPVAGYRPDGTVLWYGQIVAPPKVDEGIARFAAQGLKARLEKYRSRFPYQIRDYSQWAPGDADIYGYSAMSDNISYESQYGQLKWSIDDAVTITAGERYRAVLWVPGFPIRRIEFTFKHTADGVHYEIQIETARGPDGTFTTNYTHSLSGVGSTDVDRSFTGREDLVSIMLVRKDDGTTNLNRTFRAIKLLVNVWAKDDKLSVGEVVVDVGGRLGLDTTGVRASAPNCMPLDFTGTAAELLNYLAVFDSMVWMVLEALPSGDRLVRVPWDEQQWYASSERGASFDLEPLEQFNRVTVPYTTTSGSLATVSVDAWPDPLSERGIKNEYLVEALNDQQGNANIATQVAEEILTQVSGFNVRGSAKLARVWGDDGEHPAWDVTAGGMLNAIDYQPTIPSQRIVTATYTPGGIVDVALGQDIGADALLARIAARTARRN